MRRSDTTFVLYANKNQLAVKKAEPLTSGSVNVYHARFEFSPEWDELTRIACFRSGQQAVSVVLDKSGECTIPWEVVDPDDVGKHLYAGVYGMQGGVIVLPTVWADCGNIQQGVYVGSGPRPPTPDLWQQLFEQKGDKLGYTSDGDLGLYSGDELLSSVPVKGGGEGSDLPVATNQEVNDMLNEVFGEKQMQKEK